MFYCTLITLARMSVFLIQILCNSLYCKYIRLFFNYFRPTSNLWCKHIACYYTSSLRHFLGAAEQLLEPERKLQTVVSWHLFQLFLFISFSGSLDDLILTLWSFSFSSHVCVATEADRLPLDRGHLLPGASGRRT